MNTTVLKIAAKRLLQPDEQTRLPLLHPGDDSRMAAIELARDFPDDPLAIALLIRGASDCTLSDSIRVQCMRGLVQSRGSDMTLVMTSLVFDSDEEIRLAALEALALIDNSSATRAATILGDDEYDLVANLANDILRGNEITRYLI